MDARERPEVPEYIKPNFRGASNIQRYREQERLAHFSRDIENRFICLKGFSSSTPIIHSATFGKSHRGGGFYFRFAGHGIVVDPGIGFISLMHDHQIYIGDIDTVIVTHSHVDHNNDVKLLSALYHDYENGHARERAFLENFFPCGSNTPSRITWYMDEETIRSTKDILNGQTVIPLSEYCDAPHALGEKIALHAVRTQHIKGSQDTYGIKLCFTPEDESTKVTWGYTSDTHYFEGLASFFQNLQVLIFNISDAYRTDVEDGKTQSGHLGFTGSQELLQAAKPVVALASEFRCTNGDYRFEIVKALKEKSESRILPANPGLSLDIASSHVRCSLCGRYAGIDQIRVARPRAAYERIEYVCENCLI